MPAILQSLLTLVLVVGAFGFMFERLYRIGVLINTGTRPSETLGDRPGERLGKVAELVLGHKKVFEDRWAGFMHLFFLYGFLTLGIGHVEIVIEGLTKFREAFGGQAFGYAQLLPAGLTALYHLSQDLLAAAVLLMAAIALVRRVFGLVPRLLPRSRDAEIILWFIVGLYITFFLYVGSGVALRMQASADYAAVAYQPVSSFVARPLATLSYPTVRVLHALGFWAHVLVFLGFAVYIPLSKHMHLVFATPNIYFFRKQRFGLPEPIDFENSEKFGVARIDELPWKSLLDTFACTECGRCNAACPAHATGKPLMPMKVLHDVKLNLRYDNGPELLCFRDPKGRPLTDKAEAESTWEPKTPLVTSNDIKRDDPAQVRPDGGYVQVIGQVHVDEMWACTTCAACVQVCPVLIDSVPGTLIGLRQAQVMMDSEFPQEAQSAFRGMEVQGNPWGVGQDRREEWAESLDVPTFAAIKEREPGREVEYLFWVGCAGATDPRARKTQQALVKVLKAAKVDFAILGCEEKCTGDPARRMGNEYVFAQLAQENVETLKQYKFKKIVATCPHCFNSLGKEYREFGGEFEVIHHTELLAELLRDRRVPLDARKGLEEHVTFHDPCYLGRYNQRYDSPREVIVQLGVRKSEMAQSRERGFCCGAGGGRVFLEETIGKRVNVERTEQAIATGAGTVAVGCPFCMTMITDGTKAKGVDETLRVKDVAELVAERLAE
jgi:Fe-S oxidoreductase